MLSVRHHPELATPALEAWLRPFVRYDGDGRGSCWLTANEGLPILLASVANTIAPGVTFCGVLLQSYRDGRAITPCHTDKGATGFSFILSLGAPRTFSLHPICDGCGNNVVSIEVVNGTVIAMDEAFHTNWHHQLFTDPHVTEEKLSLVFRTPLGG